MPIVNPTDFPIIAATTSGSDLADRLNRLFDAYESNQFNPQRPLQLQKGGVWTRAEQNGDMTLMFYDGANDHEIGNVTASGSSLFGSGKPFAHPFNIATNYKKDEIIYDKLTKTYYSAKAPIAAGQPFNIGEWTALDNVFNEIHQPKGGGLCHVGTTPPEPPWVDGMMWYDTSNPDKPVFKVYHDGGWDTRGFGAPSEYEIEYLVVGGGGGGGSVYLFGGGGGGGAGAVYEGKKIVQAGSNFSCIVGAGGEGMPFRTPSGGSSGGDSSLQGIVTCQGGAKGGYAEQYVYGNGGASGAAIPVDGTGIAAFPGGSSSNNPGNDNRSSGGGGGGSRAPGAIYTAGGTGGGGYSTSISGSAITYGVGGNGGRDLWTGGGVQPTSAGYGSGGGGVHGDNNLAGTPGNPGVIVLKMPTKAFTGKTTGNPTVTQVLDMTIVTFTATGSYET